MESKETHVVELFFISPKHWHFEELLEKASISRSQLNNWLKKLQRENFIKRVKQKGKMPYYVQNFENPSYQNKKRLFGLQKLNESGLFDHISMLDGAKVAILFGSFSRFDWHDKSDIDIFIYGSDDNFEKAKYELKLNRNIQVFTAKNKQDLKKLGHLLMQNILGGFIIKGNFEQLGVKLSV